MKRPRSPALIALAALASGVGAAGGLAACATDNGDTVHGPQFGPTPLRPDGSTPEAAPGDRDAAEPDAAEAGADAGPDAAISCDEGGTVAVLAGNGTSLAGAVQEAGRAWVGGAVAGAAARSLPALVPTAAGFLGVTHGAGDRLQSVSLAAGATAFGAPTTFGVEGVKTSPSLAVLGGKVHVVYSAGAGSATTFFHGVHDASWDAATDPVGAPPGDPQSFGNSAAGLAAAGAELAFAQAGSDDGVYFRTWSTAWTMYTGTDGIPGVDGAGADDQAAPALVSVAGTFDVVLVYAHETTKKVYWTARNGTTKTFGAPALVNASPTTYAATIRALSLAAVSATELLLTFQGTDDKGYLVRGTLGASTIDWSAPAPLAPAGVTVDSTPRAAKGVCGDEAIVAFASAGQIRAIRRRGGTWSTSEALPVVGSRVAIATR